MWFYFVFEAAWVFLAWGLMEYFYNQGNYYCYFTPFEDGSGQVSCQYLP